MIQPGEREEGVADPRDDDAHATDACPSTNHVIAVISAAAKTALAKSVNVECRCVSDAAADACGVAEVWLERGDRDGEQPDPCRDFEAGGERRRDELEEGAFETPLALLP